MKLQTLAVLATLLSIPVMAQTLPDEINHQPYLENLRSIQGQISQQRNVISNLNSDIAEARRYIQESRAFIAQKHKEIQNHESEIAEHRSVIPQLQRDIQNKRSQISQHEAERQRLENNLQNLRAQEQQVRSQLRPLEASLNVKKDQIRRMEQELSQFQREESSAAQKVAELTRRGQQLDSEVTQERAQQESMKQELRQIEAKIAQIQASIQTQESSLATQQNAIRTEEGKLSALNDRVREYQDEVNRLRASGAPADQIQMAERKLNAATSKRDEVSQSLNSMRNEIAATQSRINQLKSQIESERRNQGTLTARISQSEQRERELVARRQSTNQELSAANAEAISAQRRGQAKVEQIRQAQVDLRSDESTVLRLQQNLNALNTSIDQNRAAESSARDAINQLNHQITNLSSDERQRTHAIPQLEAAVRAARSDISKSEQAIRTAQAEESQFLRDLSNAESRLSQLRSNESSTEDQYETRLSLYNRYFNESNELGQSQVVNADKLGQQAGLLMSKVKSESVGSAIGKELGSSEGKYWATVRAEIQGYPKGYKLGLISQDDIQRGIREGQAKGYEASHAHAQSQLKPKFFDGFYLEELKKPVVAVSNKMLKTFNELLSRESVTAGIDPVTAPELQTSQEILSSLDAVVSASSKEVSKLNGKYQSLSSPATVFETPTTIPYGTVQCGKVYKGIQIFKDACASSYKEHFRNIFVDMADSTFADNYPALFHAEAKKTRPDAQTNAFNPQFQSAFKTAENDGLLQGKEDIYNSTYNENYKNSYASELPAATEKAKLDAKGEVKTWIQQNATVTIESNSFSRQTIRGGDEVKLLVDLKNLSPQDLKSSVLLKVSTNPNVQLTRTEYAVTKVPGSKISRFEEITFKVPANARSGEKISFKVDAVMPGHKYQNQRSESFKIEKTLAANPKIEVKADYDSRPDIRSIVLRTKIHKLVYTITPVIEDIADGYEVLMEVETEKNYINLQASTKLTGPVKANEAKKIEYSYTFPKQAKNRKIMLKLTVKYLGEVIQVTPIELHPSN
ncbi:MAG: hypothetical protein H0V66_10950 [Bdellovibrionales bacterium]|nr:hypothetical protein [Bdellovibrionales bacterium]